MVGYLQVSFDLMIICKLTKKIVENSNVQSFQENTYENIKHKVKLPEK